MHSLFAGFPNLHPLFVHFPIVLLLLAAVAQSSVLFFPTNTQLKWLSFSLIVSATVGAFIACKTGVHISGDADEKAFPIFETHKLLANITYWTSIFAALVRLISLKWYSKKWVEYAIMGILFVAAVLVTITAHHGAQMVYIYGIGPQGNGVLPE